MTCPAERGEAQRAELLRIPSQETAMIFESNGQFYVIRRVEHGDDEVRSSRFALTADSGTAFLPSAAALRGVAQ